MASVERGATDGADLVAERFITKESAGKDNATVIKMANSRLPEAHGCIRLGA